MKATDSLPHVSPTIEGYLEAIYNMRDEGKSVIGARLADRLGVSPSTVSATLRRMTRDGLVEVADDNEIHLTTSGRKVAEATIRRHRLLERFLTDYLGLSWHQAHEEAGPLQHALSSLVEASLAEALGNPQTCPHGNPIPGTGAARLPPEAITLDQAQTGQMLVIERITEEGERDLQLLAYLEAHGVVPGARLEVDEVAPWNEMVNVLAPLGKASLGFKAARTIWARPDDQA